MHSTLYPISLSLPVVALPVVARDSRFVRMDAANMSLMGAYAAAEAEQHGMLVGSQSKGLYSGPCGWANAPRFVRTKG
jgi:hypothetical protein